MIYLRVACWIRSSSSGDVLSLLGDFYPCSRCERSGNNLRIIRRLDPYHLGIRAPGLSQRRFVDLLAAAVGGTVDLFCSSRFVCAESEQGRISIGRYIKLSFQRVLICLIGVRTRKPRPFQIQSFCLSEDDDVRETL